MKKEAGIAERKLLARNERILNLEQLLQDADRRLVQQNVKFEGQLVAMKERIEAAKCESSFLRSPSLSFSDPDFLSFLFPSFLSQLNEKPLLPSTTDESRSPFEEEEEERPLNDQDLPVPRRRLP